SEPLLRGLERRARERTELRSLLTGTREDLAGGGHRVEVAGTSGVLRTVDVGHERGARELGLGQAIARELHGEDRDRHADRDLVQSDAVRALGADANVASQQDERTPGEGVPGAGDDERKTRAVEFHQQIGAAPEE